MKLVIGLVNEFEGDAPLYFDLNDKETPERLVEYIKNNVEHGDNHEYFLRDMTDEEFAELDND